MICGGILVGLLAPLRHAEGYANPLFWTGLVAWGLAGRFLFLRRHAAGWMLWGAVYWLCYGISARWLADAEGLGARFNEGSPFLRTLLCWAVAMTVAVAMSGFLRPDRPRWDRWLLVAAGWGVAVGIGGFVVVALSFVASGLVRHFLEGGNAGPLTDTAGLLGILAAGALTALIGGRSQRAMLGG